ncbi:hypothetical protein FRC04_011443 [Tulasnella sp. 424]|nr:hypothetical protein FRC04_011443 [Tulasnella sp. 424]
MLDAFLFVLRALTLPQDVDVPISHSGDNDIRKDSEGNTISDDGDASDGGATVLDLAGEESSASSY